MIAKKNSRYDLERKRIVLFQVGLLAAGSFVLAAFTYTTETPSEFEKNVVSYADIDYLTVAEKEPEQEERVQEQQQQQEQQTQQQEQTAGNSQAISEQISSTENTSTTVQAGVSMPDIGIIGDSIVGGGDEDIIYPYPTKEAQYTGGFGEMQKHIFSVLQYPEVDIYERNQGKVYVAFVVEKDGSVSNVEIERGVSETIDREAKRIVRSFPKWIPGENLGGVVRTRVRLPINFVVE